MITSLAEGVLAGQRVRVVVEIEADRACQILRHWFQKCAIYSWRRRGGVRRGDVAALLRPCESAHLAGNGDRYYAQMAAENHMDRLQVEVVKLNDELAEILNEADYMKEKEVRFHRKAERVNLASIWWPILQIAILMLTAVFQVQSLKSYFQTKSLY